MREQVDDDFLSDVLVMAKLEIVTIFKSYCCKTMQTNLKILMLFFGLKLFACINICLYN